MSAKFTPGPWRVGVLRHCDVFVNTRQVVASCPRSREVPDGEREANARLIAAAPELLAALELAEATLQRLAPNGSRATQGTRDVARAAIEKAKGGES